MISEMGLQSSTCDKQISPGHGNGLPDYPRNGKAVAEMQNFFRAKVVQ